MCASCQALLDDAGLLFQAGTMITMRRNVNNLFTVVAEETPTDSKPMQNVDRDVEKVNYPLSSTPKNATIKIRECVHFGLFYSNCFETTITDH